MQDQAEGERALRHVPDDFIPPLEVLSLQAWFAARASDAAGEQKAFEGMIEREPGNLRALARLADLALAAGEPEKTAAFRVRRAELNRVMYQYETALQNPGPGDAEATGAMARLQAIDARRP